jgi:hypothetical protein
MAETRPDLHLFDCQAQGLGLPEKQVRELVCRVTPGSKKVNTGQPSEIGVPGPHLWEHRGRSHISALGWSQSDERGLDAQAGSQRDQRCSRQKAQRGERPGMRDTGSNYAHQVQEIPSAQMLAP